MSFLAPLFLVGGLAVALPIIFHLIRRTTREKLPFSSLMFLMPTPPKLTRRNRLENIFLLLLRCLILLLLAFGFARPFLQKSSSMSLDPAMGRQILVLLDKSASMQREDLWGRATARALETVRQASPVDEVAVIAFDRNSERVVTFDEWNSWPASERGSRTEQRFNELKPGWGSTGTGAALMGASEMLSDAASKRNAPGSGIPQRIVLISDLQEGSSIDSLQGYEWPRGLEIAIEPIHAGQPGNAGLQRVAESEELKSGDTAPVRVRVLNSADSTKEQFELRWAGATNVSTETMPVYVPPGQSRIVQAPPQPGADPGRLVLSGDHCPFDNTVHVGSTAPEQVTILFFGDDSPDDPDRLLFYLHRAFQQTTRQAIRLRSVSASAPLEAGELDQAHLAIVHRLPGEQSLQALREFVSRGKIVFIPMTSPDQGEVVAAFIAGFTVEEDRTFGYTMFSQIAFDHPLFAPFADPRFSDFTKIHFWRYRRFSTDAIPQSRVLARFENNDPALVQFPWGGGSVLVLASGWHPKDSQLALSSKFVPLLYSILELSSGAKPKPLLYFVGDALPVPAALEGSSSVLILPHGERVALESGAKRFTEADIPGLYTIISGTETQQFAVNIHPGESRTAPLAIEDFQRLGLPLGPELKRPDAITETERTRLAATELEGQQKLWRWLIVAALMVLMTESWLGGRMSRQTVPTGAKI